MPWVLHSLSWPWAYIPLLWQEPQNEHNIPDFFFSLRLGITHKHFNRRETWSIFILKQKASIMEENTKFTWLSSIEEKMSSVYHLSLAPQGQSLCWLSHSSMATWRSLRCRISPDSRAEAGTLYLPFSLDLLRPLHRSRLGPDMNVPQHRATSMGMSRDVVTI